ncbi:UPF0598 protein CG30010, partial [Trichonephila clavata]
KKFLQFFFRRLKFNDTNKYQKEFPFLSPCGKEKNFVRCDDLPIVFTHILESENSEEGDYLSYGPEATGGVGLIKSSLAIHLSQKFIYQDKENTDDMPISFFWKGVEYNLSNEIIQKLKSSLQSMAFVNFCDRILVFVWW